MTAGEPRPRDVDGYAAALAQVTTATARHRFIRQALLDAQHEGAARAFDQLAAELAAGTSAPATPELLRALAASYRAHLGVPAERARP